MSMNPAGPGGYPMTSLYVGDLHPEITEAMLFEKFSTAGPVLSIQVCRDMITRCSLGYAYVNFQQPADAERALNTMNFDKIKGRPIRIMWSQRDPRLRKHGIGNVVIKNLDKSIDSKALYDTFSAFGNIITCKNLLGVISRTNNIDPDLPVHYVTRSESMLFEAGSDLKIVCDEHESRGFVDFETEEASRNAIEKVNGMVLNGKKVFVGRFMNRHEQLEMMGDKVKKFNNIYVKNLSEDADDDGLPDMFEPYGKIISAKVDETVAVLQSHQAQEATTTAAPRKGSHRANFKKKNRKMAQQQQHTYSQAVVVQGQEPLTSHMLASAPPQEQKQMLGEHLFPLIQRMYPDLAGKITGMLLEIDNSELLHMLESSESLKTKVDETVAVLQSHQAQEATTTAASRKGSHRANFKKKNRKMAQQQQHTYSQAVVVQGQEPLTSYMLASAPPQEQKQMLGERLFPLIQRMYPDLAGKITGMLLEIDNSELLHMLESSESLKTKVGEAIAVLQSHQAQEATTTAASRKGRHRANFKKKNRKMAQQQQHTYSQAVVVQGQEPLTSYMLASAPPQEQKQMLGERLFPLIQRMYPDLAGKITGMLLEIDNSELLHMLESSESLKTKVDETIAVLQSHQAQEATTTAAPRKGSHRANFKKKNRKMVQQQQPTPPQAVVVQGQQPLTSHMLASASPQGQKQMLGERLFPLIQRMYPDLAGKITGMLLEIDNSELLQMLESSESLKAKVDEAVAVLQAHQAKEAATQHAAAQIVCDEHGSRGYGFVHFETEEAARNAIEKVNGMLLNGKKVFVGRFMNRRERLEMMGDKVKKFNNVYVKNLSEDVDDDGLRDMFEPYGKIISAKVIEEPESAERALEEMNGKELRGKLLFAGRAQKNAERQAELKEKFERIKMEHINRYQGVNLYVKNLDDVIDDERLRKEFSQFGTITSARVMTENGRTKGFGFVCFSSPEEATKAMTVMNGRIIVKKPLYVALDQRKEDRKAYLASQYMQRIASMRMQANDDQLHQPVMSPSPPRSPTPPPWSLSSPPRSPLSPSPTFFLRSSTPPPRSPTECLRPRTPPPQPGSSRMSRQSRQFDTERTTWDLNDSEETDGANTESAESDNLQCFFDALEYEETDGANTESEESDHLQCLLDVLDNLKQTLLEEKDIVVRREFVFEDLNRIYGGEEEPELLQHKIHVKFEGELGIDGGGLTRDMFASYWNCVTRDFFDGEAVKVPCVPTSRYYESHDVFRVAGRVLTHALLLTGSLPLDISMSFLWSAIKPSSPPTDEIVLKDFNKFVSAAEARAIAMGLEETAGVYSDDLMSQLTDIFTRFGMNSIPSPKHFREQVLKIARVELIAKPSYFGQIMMKGVPNVWMTNLWGCISECGLIEMYRSLQPTPQKVLQKLETKTDEEYLSSPQQMAFIYLKDFIRCLDSDALAQFLHFTTGSTSMPTVPIVVSINNRTGLNRIPKAYTCGPVLEISTAYSSLSEFKRELEAVIFNDELHAMSLT